MAATSAGRGLLEKLPYERVEGPISAKLPELWSSADAFVLACSTGVAVRIAAPLLDDKRSDPAIVCVDDLGTYAVALCGGHLGGANALARDVAALIGADAVVTTASDLAGVPALDDLQGFVASGDVAGVMSAMLGGRSPVLVREIADWPVPLALQEIVQALADPTGDRDRSSGAGRPRIVLTDREPAGEAGTVLLHPPSLVVGVGCSSDATPEETVALIEDALGRAGLARESVSVICTVDRRAWHSAVCGLGKPVMPFSPAQLSTVAVPNPSGEVERVLGTPSVAEAAALLGAGEGAVLVVEKLRSRRATVAVARRTRVRGVLKLVGLGPGDGADRTPAATTAVRSAEVVIGYERYVQQIADLLTPGQHVVSSPIGAEHDRAKAALSFAAEGRSVAMVCSGDAGVYAMASLVMELAPSSAPDVQIDVVPGITAALSSAALLGAPLGHDHASISLSDLLTPWDVITGRLEAAARGDFVVSLYNCRSTARHWQLRAALDVLAKYRPPGTPAGVVTDAGRAGERVTVTSLAALDTQIVGMNSCVVVGSTRTYVAQGRMVTPRGYVR